MAQMERNHLKCRSSGFNLWVGKIPWQWELPLQYFSLEKSMNRRASQSITHGVLKSWTQLSNFLFLQGKHTPFSDWSWVPPIRHMLAPSHICIGANLETSAGKASAYNAGHPGWIPGSGISSGEGIGYLCQYS